MCGIFCFVSSKGHKPSELLEGLKILEYRGYDSWGIAVKTQNRIIVEKHTGKIGDAALNSQFSKLNLNLGIGHTRWATHGKVSPQNSHPHLDCQKRLAIVHNGIFENYEEKKKELLKTGHKFKSQTDSEVIVHLMEENLKKMPLKKAAMKTFSEIKGLNAIIVIDSFSNEIIALKNGSSLIIGATDNTYYIASDISAIAMTSKEFVVLEDNQMAIIGSTIEIYTLPSGKKVSYKKETISKGQISSSIGNFPHFLLKEIYDQPKILSNLLKSKDIEKLANSIKKADKIFLLGCGSASYAAQAGVYLFSKIANKHVNFAVGSEFSYIQDAISKKSLVIPISQSGETIDVISPVKEAKKRGAGIVSIVNVPTSTLARLSDYSLLLNAGEERAVVGTKSFTSMVGILLLTAYSISNQDKNGKKLITKTASGIKKILLPDNISKTKKLSNKLKTNDNIFLIGRGLSYIGALEGALKLKETSLIHAEGFAGGELKHGVIALIEKGTPCFVIATNDETYSEIISNAQEVKSRGGFIIGIGPKENSVFDEFLKTDDAKEATLILQIVYMQILAYFLALKRGIEDPDKPRNLAKSVTVK